MENTLRRTDIGIVTFAGGKPNLTLLFNEYMIWIE